MQRVYFMIAPVITGVKGAPFLTLRPQDAAVEPTELLRAVKVALPYVLIGNSYGELIAREFLDLHSMTNGVVVGMVLAESATELMYEVFPTLGVADYIAVTVGVNFMELTHLREESNLSDEEWEAMVEAIARTEPGSRRKHARQWSAAGSEEAVPEAGARAVASERDSL